MTSQRILVTGATGFLGSAVSAHLEHAGFEVRKMARRTEPTAKEDVVVVPDICDRDAVREAVSGMDVVVHLAARAHVMTSSAGSYAAFRKTNVEGTRVVMEEAAAAGVRKLVFFSSVKAVGEENTSPWTEDVFPRPVDSYGVSKLRAEETVRELESSSGMGAVILRLPLAYGPGMKGNMLRLFDAVRHSVPLPLGNVRNRRSLVFSGNVAEAVSCVIRSPNSVGNTFFVSDGADLSTSELLRAVGAALGKRPTLFPVPSELLMAVGRVAEVLAPTLFLAEISETLRRLLGSLTVDISKLRRVTGYSPPFTVEAGLRETASWYDARTGTS